MVLLQLAEIKGDLDGLVAIGADIMPAMDMDCLFAMRTRIVNAIRLNALTCDILQV